MDEDRRGRSRLTRGGELGAFFVMGSGFWRGPTRLIAWAASIGLVALTFAALGFQVALNAWNRRFFDALDARDAAKLFDELQVFIVIIAAGLAIGAAFVVARMVLQLRWRDWMVRHLIALWMREGRGYQLEVVDGDHANPEFRIATDVQRATEMVVDLSMGFLSAALSAAAFIGVLVAVGGGITLPVLGGIHVPAYMLIAAILYSALATLLMYGLGRPLIGLTEGKNQAEAELLYALTKSRENAEAIALGGGEERGRDRLAARLGDVIARWFGLMRRQSILSGVSGANGVLIGVVPLLLLAPKYVGGDMTLGQLMQAASAFSFVVIAFNWFFDNFQKFAEWNASVNRVVQLLRAIERIDAEMADPAAERIRIVRVPGETLRLIDVQVMLDDGRVVIADADVSVRQGERVLIEGGTGVGKSMLVRAIAGLWPWGSGRIEIPGDRRLMVCPQKPYLPSGTLKAIATYPTAPEAIPDVTVAAAFALCGLEQRVPELGAVERWEQNLSEGDQQRIAFARVLIARPDILIMDEASAAIDPAEEYALYVMLREQLPATTLLTISQNSALASAHDRTMSLEIAEGGSARLKPERARAKASPGILRRLADAWHGPAKF